MGTSVEMIEEFYKKRMRYPKMATEVTKHCAREAT
jgi:hypothetical protein